MTEDRQRFESAVVMRLHIEFVFDHPLAIAFWYEWIELKFSHFASVPEDINDSISVQYCVFSVGG